MAHQLSSVPLEARLPLLGSLTQTWPNLLKKLFLGRTGRTLVDAGLVFLCLSASYAIRFDGAIPAVYREQILPAGVFLAFLYVGMNYVWRAYRTVWHFVGLRDAVLLGQSVAASAVLLLVINVTLLPFQSGLRIPLGVIVLHPILTFGAWIAARVMRRITFPYLVPYITSKPGRRVLMIGAGQAGLLLLQELRARTDFQVVGFVDDNPELFGRSIEGIPVLGTTHNLKSILMKHAIDEVTLCMPSAPSSTALRVASHCRELQVKVSTVPSLSEIVLGKVSISRIRPVEMQDLLKRDSVSYLPDDDLLKTYRDRCVLVTGAAGSIGSELARQIANFRPARLILLDKDENGLFETAPEIQSLYPEAEAIVANIREFDALDELFRMWRPEVVVHAAAYKHVPLMESHPREAVLNNVIGTRNLVELADRHGVKTFVLISTDKAVNPSSVMGASKRIAEMLIQHRVAVGAQTRFCCVRFGNVLGSRGSVVPLFQKLIKQGKPIPVTHPNIQRFFMTIPEACQLVLRAGSLGDRGEIFLLDMGDPVKIVDLARNLIELSGLVPDRDIKIEFTGLRPGEKLYEELVGEGEVKTANPKYPKIYEVRTPAVNAPLFVQAVQDLEHAARQNDIEAIHRLLLGLGIRYQPHQSDPDLQAMPRAGVNTERAATA